MAVLPTFTPAQAPSTQANLSVQSQNAAQSWMDQAQMRQITQQKMDNQQQLFNDALPVIQAKNDADKITAQNQLQTGQLIQQFRTKAATDGPAAQQEYLDVANTATNDDGTPDYEGQYQNLSEIEGRYSSLKLLPEWQPLMQQIEGAKKNAYDSALKQSLAAAALQRVQAAAAGRAQVATIGADSRSDVAATNASARTDVATIGAGARTAAADKAAGARLGAASIGAGGRVSAAQINSWTQAAQQADAQAATLKDTDPETAQVFSNKAQQYRDKVQAASQQSQAPAPDSPSPAGGAGGAPQIISVNGQNHVVLGGKAFPILKDPTTNRRYYKDGNTVKPLPGGDSATPSISFTPPAAPDDADQ